MKPRSGSEAAFRGSGDQYLGLVLGQSNFYKTGWSLTRHLEPAAIYRGRMIILVSQ